MGTHIDALCHYSCGGKLHGGQEAATVQSYAGGIEKLSVDTIAPIFRRGVLLDIAGPAILPEDFEITPAHLDAARRTSRSALAMSSCCAPAGQPTGTIPASSFPACAAPVPRLAGARWLSARGIFAAGSDTLAFEKVPAPGMPVHVHLLVEHGIHIMECLNLEELSASCVYEFLFIAAPLKIRGATGAPIRPIAVEDHSTIERSPQCSVF